jgi:hypothetical protein
LGLIAVCANKKSAHRPFLDEEDGPRAPCVCRATLQPIKIVSCVPLCHAADGQSCIGTMLATKKP